MWTICSLYQSAITYRQTCITKRNLVFPFFTSVFCPTVLPFFVNILVVYLKGDTISVPKLVESVYMAFRKDNACE